MEVRLYDDIAAFADVAVPLLHADPVRHTVAVTVLAEYLAPSAPKDIAALLTVHDDGVVEGAALRVGRWPLITSALPPKTAPAVAETLSHRLQWPPGRQRAEGECSVLRRGVVSANRRLGTRGCEPAAVRNY